MSFVSTMPSNISAVILISARITPLFIGVGSSPFSRIPMMVRLIFVLVFAISISQVISFEHLSLTDLVIGIFTELFIGLTFLLVIHAAFSALLFWGRVVDMQIGLGAAGIINPATKSQDSLTGTIISLLATTLFFVMGIHLLLLETVVFSYTVFPLGKFAVWLSPQKLASFWGIEFLTAMMLFAPIMITIWSLDIIVGILSKTMPQVNIYFVTLPLKIGVGIVLFSVMANYSKPIFEKLFNQMLSVLQVGG